MASIPAARIQTERIAATRLWWLGPLAAGASALATVLVRMIAVAAFGVPATLQALAPLWVAGATIAAVLAATLVFAALDRFTRHPIRLFQILAVVVILNSPLPFLVLYMAPSLVPGMNVQAAWTMEAMHLVAGAITVGLFTTLGREQVRQG